MSGLTLTADMPIIRDGHFDLEIRRAASAGRRICHVTSLPWQLFADPCDRQCQTNHSGQTLEKLRLRHGISAREALAILACEPFEAFEGVSTATAHKVLYAWTAAYRRGGLPAPIGSTPPPSEPPFVPAEATPCQSEGEAS